MTENIPWSSIPQSLIEKYSGRTPRYTSYPTAVEWKETFDRAAFERALAEADTDAQAPLSIYIHIPFCIKRCLFCGCASDVSVNTADYDAYLDALFREIDAAAARLPQRRDVTQLHLGGGTPTVLDSRRLERLIEHLKAAFDFSRAAELALEAAPVATSIEQIETLGDLGFNRISLGVQDFTPEVQRAVDRVQSKEHILSLIERARARGFAVNLDLMYGLPEQRLDTWRETLQQLTAVRPDRAAVFGYAHVPWMRPHQQQISEADLPEGPERLALFRAAHERLLDAGYVYIGMDHFALRDDPLSIALSQKQLSRNFQGYTVRQASVLLGLGTTAISDLGIAFAQNLPKTKDYSAQTKQTGLTTYRGIRLTAEDLLRRHIITEIMCNLTLDIQEVEKRFSINFQQHFSNERAALQALETDGLIHMNEKHIRVSALGRLFVRRVALAFDTYSQKETPARIFSRTV
jgi:oxygen-independent coproporphyrinogen III oxidase